MDDNTIQLRIPLVKEQSENKEAVTMTTVGAKGGIRNRKVVAVLESFVYPDVREAMTQVKIFPNRIVHHPNSEKWRA